MKANKQQFLTEKFNDYQNEQLSRLEKGIIDEWFDAKLEEAGMESTNNNLSTNHLQQEVFKNIRQLIHLVPANKPWYSNIWLKAACIMLMLSGLTLFVLQYPADKKAETQIAWQIYSTAKGEVKNILLPDGTAIWMNAGTQIRLSSDFTKSKSRELMMDYGEAFFEVKRDTLRPFSITSGRMVTTVLGTSFNIRSYPESNAYKVAVSSGKVKVTYKDAGSDKTLSSGLVKNQLLTYDISTQKSNIKNQDVSRLSQWKTNRSLNFDNLTLKQIGAELSRQYNIDVKVNETKKAKQTYTMYLEHQDIRIVLQQIVLKTGINYQLTSNTLILNPGI